MSDLFQKIIEERKSKGWTVVACRICGELWMYPPGLAEHLKDEHGLDECAFCKHRGRI